MMAEVVLTIREYCSLVFLFFQHAGEWGDPPEDHIMVNKIDIFS